jgi:hypothetical protein
VLAPDRHARPALIPARGRARVPALLLALGAAVLSAACSSDVSVEGVVSDPERQPIAGAIVTLQDHSHAAAFETTDAKGSFAVKISRQPGARYPMTLTVSAPDRQPIQTDLLEEASYWCTILMPRPDPKAPKAPPARTDGICVKTE